MGPYIDTRTAILFRFMNLSDEIRSHIREVPDFPENGINFKDISPIFLNQDLLRDIPSALANPWNSHHVDKVIGIDSRGFLFGPQMAVLLNAGFIMVRKKGKLPPETVSVSYELEYGEAELESTVYAIQPGDKVIIHDDLLATGGTASAAAALVKTLQATVIGFSFLIQLEFLNGRDKLITYSPEIHALVQYDS